MPNIIFISQLKTLEVDKGLAHFLQKNIEMEFNRSKFQDSGSSFQKEEIREYLSDMR